MGEIAEMMLDGELCQVCGVYMGEACGYPRMCRACERDENLPPPNVKVPCKKCGKLVKQAGLADHIKAVHPAKVAP